MHTYRLATVLACTVLASGTLSSAADGSVAEESGQAATQASSPNCTAKMCSFDVAPGLYEVRVALGSRTSTANTGLQAEARRTVLAPVSTARGDIAERSITVDVRSPESMPDGQEGDGTPGLQIYLTGDTPALDGIEVIPKSAEPQLFVISDSTAADWLSGPKRGWGQEIPQYFRAGLAVSNYAVSGSSTISWLADPDLFAKVKPLIRPGDEVLIQLAHNDKNTEEGTYRNNLTTIVNGVRERGGSPVLVTPPVRHLFASDGTITPTGRVVNNLGVDLPAVMRDLAVELHVPLLDLTARSKDLLEGLGEARSWYLYLTAEHDGVKDSSHFSEDGATAMAQLVTQEMVSSGIPAVQYLR